MRRFITLDRTSAYWPNVKQGSRRSIGRRSFIVIDYIAFVDYSNNAADFATALNTSAIGRNFAIGAPVRDYRYWSMSA